MVQTINLTAEIPETREIHITLPKDTPTGLVKLLIQVMSEDESQGSTLGDLLNSEFFGMWQDRADITDSAEFARWLRQQSWSRTL